MAIHFLNDFSKRILNKISSKWQPDVFWRLPDEAYTLEHKLAFLEREHYLTGGNTLSGWLHDCDKLFLYLVPFLTEKQIQKFHRTHQAHHTDYPQNKVEQLIQTYIDWDCAALTKPDKPLNAFATLLHFYRDKLPLMLPVCLAIAPDDVTPLIADLDETRKKGNVNYLFDESMNKDICCNLTCYTYSLLDETLPINASNEVTFIHTLRLLNRIIQGLIETVDIIQTRFVTLDYIISCIPKDFSKLKPIDLFLKTLDLLAKSRHQRINLQNCIDVLQAKKSYFLSYSPKFKIDTVSAPIKHSFCNLSPNPLLEY